MDIVIIADFCGDFESNWKNFRFLYLADLLSENNQVELITSDFNHASKTFFKNFRNDFRFKVTYLHETGYPRNVCIKRFISHYIWGKNVKRYLMKRTRPDVVYAAVPTLTAPFFSGKYCKRKGIRFIIDIQDLWPEAFKMVFNIPLISRMLFSPFTYLENSIFSMADAVCAVSDTYIERAKSRLKNNTKTAAVFLGTQLNLFDKFAQNQPMIEKEAGEFWVGYCGTLSESYDIPTVIKAIKLLNDCGVSNIKLVLIGDGPHKERFSVMAKNYSINFVCTGFVPYSEMCPILKQCDILVNPIIKNSAASIINKHADYAAAGLPIINSQDSIEYKHLIDSYHMGVNCKSEDEKCMANAIDFLFRDEAERIQMGNNSRKCAKDLFDRQKSYQKLISMIIRDA